MKSEAIILGSYLTGGLHTARIRNVDVTMCGERMKDGKLINQYVTSVVQRKNL